MRKTPKLHITGCYGHKMISEYFELWISANFFVFVLLEAYNSTLLRILLVFILQDIN